MADSPPGQIIAVRRELYGRELPRFENSRDIEMTK